MATLAALGARHGHWLVVAALGACAVATACSDGTEPGATSGAGGDGGASSSGATNTSSSGASGGEEPDAGSSSGALTPDAGASGIETEPNLRVAFIGDTASGADFRAVLKLIRDEGAKLVLIQGDLTYSGERPKDWFPVIDNAINKATPGSTATVTIPYFVSQGNHDQFWDETGPLLQKRLTEWQITPAHNDPPKRNYAISYKGLEIVFVAEGETSNPTRADYIKQRLEGDKHVWRICSWHKNMRSTNVADKEDEMPWATYDTCRAFGAIVAQGHSHTYSRTKTMTAGKALTVDANCKDPLSLCVGPGRHFIFDSSLGGRDTRDLDATWRVAPHFARTFTGAFGALFIDFNVDGNPKKARGYFKTVAGAVIDPPPASGKTAFEITSAN